MDPDNHFVAQLWLFFQDFFTVTKNLQKIKIDYYSEFCLIFIQTLIEIILKN